LVSRRWSIALVAIVAVAAGCGSSSSTSSPAPATTTPTPGTTTTTAAPFPATVPQTGGSVVIAARPERIVSLSPTATEMLFAIGAGPQVLAVDDQSSYPLQAPRTKLSGFQPSAEAIARYKPDLVVISNDPGGLLGQLEALSIPVLLEPQAATLDDAYAQVRQLGIATGNAAEADAVATGMQAKIEAAIASAPKPATPVSVYYELDNTLYSATSKTFIGSILTALGLQDVADPADTTASGYPQLSAEFLVKADPQLILLADTRCCGQSLATVAKRPGFARIAAVKAGHVVALDDDIASRWGPRLVDLVTTIAQAIPR
jgi:iron complex transport system substrate-binding protein